MQSYQAQEGCQAVRPLYKNGLSAITGGEPTDADIVFIDTHPDQISGMEMILWDDIEATFRDAIHVRHYTRVLAFLKDRNYSTLIPRRIATLPDAVLEVIVDGPFNQVGGTSSPATPRTLATPEQPMGTRQTNQSKHPSRSQHAHNRFNGQPTPRSIAPPLAPRTIPRSVPRSIVRPTARGSIGKIAAHVNLKVLEEKGEGDQAVFPKALGCYLKGVKKGHAYAQFCVGKLYLDGKDVSQSYPKAMEWFLRAADHGLAEAQDAVGDLYYSGHGVSQDYSMAKEWAFKAAHQGFAPAQRKIGILYDKGQGVPKDPSLALQWYIKAVGQGDAEAQDCIAEHYRNHYLHSQSRSTSTPSVPTTSVETPSISTTSVETPPISAPAVVTISTLATPDVTSSSSTASIVTPTTAATPIATMDYPGAGNTALRAHHSLPTMTPSKSTTSVVFVGNPGVGKSTLLNALGGNFANGMTPLGGLTKKVSSVTVNCEGRSLRLIDVPGIMESGEDNTISGNLQMLEDTLNSSGRSVLFFVVTPRNGRIAPDDFAVMKTLLTNLSKGPMVGLIITQVKRRQIPTFQSGDYYNKILGILQSAGVDTTYFERYRWLILEEHDYDFDAADRRAIRDYVFCFSPQEVKVRGFMAKMFGF